MPLSSPWKSPVDMGDFPLSSLVLSAVGYDGLFKHSSFRLICMARSEILAWLTFPICEQAGSMCFLEEMSCR